MVFCEEYLASHLPYNTGVALPVLTFTDVYPKKHRLKWFMFFYQHLTELLELFGFISCALAVRYVWDDIDVLCGCLSSVTHSCQIVAKTVHLKWGRQKFMHHLEDLERVLNSNKVFANLESSLNFDRYFKNNSRSVRIMQRIHFTIQILSTSIYFAPLVLEYFTAFSDSTLLPVIGVIPWNTESFGGFGAAFLFQVVLFYLYNMKMVAIDYFLMNIIVLHFSEIMFLNDILAELIKKAHDGSLAKVARDNLLKSWISTHQKTIRLTRSLKHLLSGYLIIEYVYALIHTCIPAFVITSTASWTVAQKTALLTMVSSGLVVLLLLAKAGDMLSYVNQLIANTMYGFWLINWPEMKISFRMYTALIYRPFHLKFLSLFPLCFPTFVSISRLILTYYMTLNEIKNMKKRG